MSQKRSCPHCGAKNTAQKTCMVCGKDMNSEPRGKNASWLMKNINKVRFVTFVLIFLLGVCAFSLEKYYLTLGKWGDVVTIAGYVFFAAFIVIFIILMFLGNKNYEDSSEELSEYKKKHTNTFIKK